MRFAFISTMHGSSWGGSEELWSQAAFRLRSEGHEVFASVAYWLDRSKRVVELAQSGAHVEVHSPHDPGRIQQLKESLLYSGPRVYDRLKQFKPDLAIISQGHNSGGIEWAKMLRAWSIPYVVVVHCNSDHWWFGEELGDTIDYYTFAQKVFCVSRGNLNLLGVQLGAPLSNAEIVFSPYNVSTDPVPNWPQETQEYSFASVARLSLAAKGQDLLLQTLALPEWRSRRVNLNLYGEGPDELALRRLAETLQLQNVHFRGQVSNIRTIWEKNHLLVLPSRFEGMPLSLIEAMWCGRPAVATDVGGNAELCVDGVTGFVAESSVLSSFSKALERAWGRSTEWQKMGLQGRKRVEGQIPNDPVALFSNRLKAFLRTTLDPSPVVGVSVANT